MKKGGVVREGGGRVVGGWWSCEGKSFLKL